MNASNLRERLADCKSRLKNIETKLLTIDGRTIRERRKGADGFVQVGEPSRMEPRGATCGLGMVYDPTPDLQCGEIIERLWIGGQDVALSKVLLRERKITHVVNAATYVPNCLAAEGVEYMNLNVLDLPCTPISDHFESVSLFIHNGRESGGAVFVHCNAGISRSSSLCIAYLMRHHNMSYMEAYEQTKEARPRICPNEGFERQLQAYEKELKSKENESKAAVPAGDDESTPSLDKNAGPQGESM